MIKCANDQGVALLDLKGTVVYAWAAPGNHILILVDMVPNVKWELFDPRPFHVTVKKHSRITTVREKFSVEKANKMCDDPVWFISDIREDTSDAGVMREMKIQAQWVKELQPKKASLKFRLPFNNTGKSAPSGESGRVIEYMDGELYGQLNAPPYSSEARLFTTPNHKNRLYPVDEHEVRMAGYNYFTRNMRFLVPKEVEDVIRRIPGYDNGFESLVELSLLPEKNIEYVVEFEKRMAEATVQDALYTCVALASKKWIILKR
jgi:hypothetical protein